MRLEAGRARPCVEAGLLGGAKAARLGLAVILPGRPRWDRLDDGLG